MAYNSFHKLLDFINNLLIIFTSMFMFFLMFLISLSHNFFTSFWNYSDTCLIK